MKLQEFKKLLIEKRSRKSVTIIIPDFEKFYFIEIKAIKNIFRYIDFECKFNGIGCKENPNSIKCCCWDCLSSIGYLEFISSHDIPYYSRKFSKKTGFWRKDKGCILPHSLRSITCLKHHCNHDIKHQQFRYGIKEITNLIEDKQKELKKLEDIYLHKSKETKMNKYEIELIPNYGNEEIIIETVKSMGIATSGKTRDSGFIGCDTPVILDIVCTEEEKESLEKALKGKTTDNCNIYQRCPNCGNII
jgi:hypothetical protein